ncbi:hypothetical protein TYRP_004707 [Tyrophagus putrescentiae]|nr:hypothetical protein TYRP_004707 [Tyrophagus putrescentiae]
MSQVVKVIHKSSDRSSSGHQHAKITSIPIQKMSSLSSRDRIVYRLVLTGGPCSGKTTGQARISTFFENLGFKVYRVPEAATTLFSGGVRFSELSPAERDKFQETSSSSCKQNCIVICDRGIMDASAYMSQESWAAVLKNNGWNPVELRDNRYNQVVHLVTAASGAEAYYNCEDNPCRTEGLEQARELDRRTAEAWLGHPYIDVIDNSTDFDTKMRRMISTVCRRIGINPGDRLQADARKTKFLVKGPVPPSTAFPPYQDFDMAVDFLVTSNPKVQSRLRKRGQHNRWSFQHLIRRSDAGSQEVELRRQIRSRDYMTMLAQRSDSHYTIVKVRRCFLWQQVYFQLDIYQEPSTSRCSGLLILETYTTLSAEEITRKLPPFLSIIREVTNDSDYCTHSLALKSADNGEL